MNRRLLNRRDQNIAITKTSVITKSTKVESFLANTIKLGSILAILGDGPVAESVFLTSRCNPGCEELESSYAGDAPGRAVTDKYTPDRED